MRSNNWQKKEVLSAAREMLADGPWRRRQDLQRMLRLTFSETVEIWEVLIEEGRVPDDREQERQAALDRYADAARALQWYQRTGSNLPHHGLSGPSDARQVAEGARRAAVCLGAIIEEQA